MKKISLRCIAAAGLFTQTALAGILCPADFSDRPLVLDTVSLDQSVSANDDLPGFPFGIDAFPEDTRSSPAASVETWSTPPEPSGSAQEADIALASGFGLTLLGLVAGYWLRAHT